VKPANTSSTACSTPISQRLLRTHPLHINRDLAPLPSPFDFEHSSSSPLAPSNESMLKYSTLVRCALDRERSREMHA
jgi:hypothetical protein